MLAATSYVFFTEVAGKSAYLRTGQSNKWRVSEQNEQRMKCKLSEITVSGLEFR